MAVSRWLVAVSSAGLFVRAIACDLVGGGVGFLEMGLGGEDLGSLEGQVESR